MRRGEEQNMTRVKYKGRYGGSCHGVHFKPGEVKDVSPNIATELLKVAGQFETVKEVKVENGEISGD